MAWTITPNSAHPKSVPNDAGGDYCCLFSFDATNPDVYLNFEATYLALIKDIAYIHGWIYVGTKGFNTAGQGFKTLVTLDSNGDECASVGVYHRSTVGLSLQFNYYDSVLGLQTVQLSDIDEDEWYEIEYKYDWRDPYIWECRVTNRDDLNVRTLGTFGGPGREPVTLQIGGIDYTGTGTTVIYHDRVTWDLNGWVYLPGTAIADLFGSLTTSDVPTGSGDHGDGYATLSGSFSTLLINGTSGVVADLAGSFSTVDLRMATEVAVGAAILNGSIASEIVLEQDVALTGATSLFGILLTSNVILSTTVVSVSTITRIPSEEVFDCVIRFSSISEVVNTLNVKFLRYWSESGDEAWKGAIKVQIQSSVTDIGEVEETEEMPWVIDESMASDVAQFWAAFKSSRRLSVEMETKWKTIDTNIGTVTSFPTLSLLDPFPDKTYLVTGIEYDFESETRTLKATEFEFEEA